ncbi:hypothetical protein Pan216_41580 [Planctomycetes bacterium Pan216]|uniref:Peptidase M48 domain-containing protein n=1 Tax=Kolteria novifilia TaxID=2527975 RepID=A0A518B8I7_9BACT|nr:hypothetical protein Pan216_41580 [Planctomycetes bacterium Pan216]
MGKAVKQRIICPTCKAVIRGKGIVPGKAFDCPACAAPIEVSQENVARAACESTSPADLKANDPEKELLAEIVKGIRHRKATEAKRSSTTGVATLMFLLFVGYLLGIVLCLFAAVYFLFGSEVLSLPGRFPVQLNRLVGNAHSIAMILVGFFFHVVLIVSAGAVALAMIKPLFARSRRDRTKVRLRPQDAPMLFALVDHLARAMDAPIPKRIEVDCGSRVEAGYRHGWWSMVRGDDFTLTIALPLLFHLRVRQLVVELSNQLARFRQGSGMRTQYFSLSIHQLFVSASQGGDAWDEYFDGLLDGRTPFALAFFRAGFMMIAFFARIAVGIAQLFFWGLSFLSGALVGGLSRQLELDADRDAIRLVGSRAFVDTLWELEFLREAQQRVYKEVAGGARHYVALRDFSGEVLEELGKLPPEVRKSVRKRVLKTESRHLDAHAATKDRITKAETIDAPGIVKTRLPAITLIKDSERLTKKTTDALMRSVLVRR